MNFAWDEEKRIKNLEKHGIDFPRAARVLCEMPLIVESANPGNDTIRCVAYGELDGILIAVVFTLREDVFWIISARPASRRERRRYAEE